MGKRAKKADELALFRAWIVCNGGEVLSPTNPYELLRFSCDRGTGIVYVNKAGQQNWTGAAAELRSTFAAGGSVPLAPRFVRKHSDKRYAALIERDGRYCWFGCGCEMTAETATIEHLCSRTHGGPDHIANTVLACRPCNRAAGHLSVAEKVALRQTSASRPRSNDLIMGMLQ